MNAKGRDREKNKKRKRLFLWLKLVQYKNTEKRIKMTPSLSDHHAIPIKKNFYQNPKFLLAARAEPASEKMFVNLSH